MEGDVGYRSNSVFMNVTSFAFGTYIALERINGISIDHFKSGIR